MGLYNGDDYNFADKLIQGNLESGRAGKTAIYYGKQQITYQQLSEMVNQAGNGLLELGIQMEQRVAILLHDSPEFIASFLGIIKIGAVAVPLNTRLQNVSDAAYFLNYSRARALIVNQDLWNEIRQLRPEFKYLKQVVVVENSNSMGNKDDNVHYYHQLIDRQKTALTAASTSKDDQALWLFTSGTTGRPKGVVHLHHDMEFCARTFGAHVLKLTAEDRIFCSSKLFFAFGLGNSLYFPLSFGASVLLRPDRTTPECILNAINRFKPTVFFGVPTLYNGILRHIEKTGQKYDFSSVRICISSAEPLPVPVYHKWQELFGLKILDCIGCTESLHAFIANTNEASREASSGRAVPGYEAKIMGADGREAPPLEIGDLWIKGDSIGLGYFNKHEATKAKFVGEWLITGDKYYRDEDGFFFYCGRSDELMKVAGMWVSPHEIESCLLKLPYIHEAAVVGGTNASGLVKPKGFVVLKDDVEPGDKLKSEILSFLDDSLPTYKRLNDLAFLKELPKTATGKIQRFKLRDVI